MSCMLELSTTIMQQKLVSKVYFVLVMMWIFRAGLIFHYSSPLGFPDSYYQYVTVAFNLFHGHGYSASKAPPYLPTTVRVPGYPFFLAVFYTPWPSCPWVPILFQVLLEGVAIILLAHLVAAWTKEPICGWF